MRYALDSCVALKWVLPEPDASVALRLRDEFAVGVHELLAPDIFAVEVAHNLVKSERKRIILPAEVEPKLSDLLAFLPDLHPYLSLLPRAIDLAASARIGVYDGLYVALAEREGCDLVTADARLKTNLPNGPILLLTDL